MSITIDTTKPNISRVYDYVLGGHHNFEVDRLAAQHILSLLPSYPMWARLNRWFLQMIAHDWNAQGIANILDLASGMPTQDHFHSIATRARVLYCDNDPITVAYAQEVVGDDPRVTYVEGDVRDMAPILRAADQHFGGQRRIGLGCVGLAYLVDDATVGPMLRTIHDWAAPGSLLAITFADTPSSPTDMEQAIDAFRRLGMAPTLRTTAELEALIAPWRLREVRALHEWLGVEKQIAPDDIISQRVEMYGAIFDHQG